MKSIYLKPLIIILIAVIMLFAFQNKTVAFVENMIDSAGEFFNEGKNSTPVIKDEQHLKTTIEGIYNVLLSISIIAALIVGIFIGIKFMTGSAEDQAKVKETLLPYTVGCIIAFGAFGIWKLVMEIINTIP